MAQPIATPPPPIPEFALKFYDLDHKLTQKDRITLRDYFKAICNKTLAGSWAMFGLGFGLVYLKNRSRISNATKAINLLKKQFPEITNEELVKKSIEMRITKPNTFGAQGFFAGVASMVFTAPFIGNYVMQREYESLIIKETGDSTISDADVSSDIGPYNDARSSVTIDAASSADDTSSQNTVVQVAKLLSLSGPFIFKWQYYYVVTAQKPEFSIEDPRERYKQLQAQYQEAVNNGTGDPGKPPLTTNRFSPANNANKNINEFAKQNPELQKPYGSNSSSDFSSPPVSYGDNKSSLDGFTSASDLSNWYSLNDSTNLANDSKDVVNDNDDFDIGNMGLGASESNDQNDQKKYQSAWDRIRDENGDNSSWNNIKKN